MKLYLCDRSLYNMLALSKTAINQEVFFILILISFFLITILKVYYWKYTKLLFKGIVAQRYANQFLREENALTERVDFISYFLMVINFSLIINALCIKIDFGIWVLLLLVFSFYILKIILFKFISLIFMIRTLGKLAIFFSFLFDRVLAIIIFPIVVLLYFFAFDITGVLAFFVSLLSASIFIIKIYWLWKISTKSFGLSHFYIFLYLCTLEIFPILLVFGELY